MLARTRKWAKQQGTWPPLGNCTWCEEFLAKFINPENTEERICEECLGPNDKIQQKHINLYIDDPAEYEEEEEWEML